MYNTIEYKKPIYKIKHHLREHLKNYLRLVELPVNYHDLLRFEESVPVLDSKGKDTLWRAVLYNTAEREQIHESLLTAYQILCDDGNPPQYLRVESIDFCSYGNSKPFRIRVANELNDNHDYFYVKRADASRVYGLELEHIFSPNKMNFLVTNHTLLEEHVVGIPCDQFINDNDGNQVANRLRLAKEFVKFNERCFVRLLGDMRAYNYVVEINQDFDNVQYRLRAMDFDQQSYEGRKNLYFPQYYKDNRTMVELAQELMTPEIAERYASQERAALKKRIYAARQRTKSLLRRMRLETLSTLEHIEQLKGELATFYKDDSFLECKSMGEILIKNIESRLGVTIFPGR